MYLQQPPAEPGSPDSRLQTPSLIWLRGKKGPHWWHRIAVFSLRHAGWGPQWKSLAGLEVQVQQLGTKSSSLVPAGELHVAPLDPSFRCTHPASGVARVSVRQRFGDDRPHSAQGGDDLLGKSPTDVIGSETNQQNHEKENLITAPSQTPHLCRIQASPFGSYHSTQGCVNNRDMSQTSSTTLGAQKCTMSSPNSHAPDAFIPSGAGYQPLNAQSAEERRAQNPSHRISLGIVG